MKITILILAICLLFTYPISTANVRELNPHSSVKSEQFVNKISFEEKLLTVIPKEYEEPGRYEHPTPNGDRQWNVVPKVSFERYGGGWEVTLSPDYSKVAYRAKLGGKVFAVVNDKKGLDFDDVRYLAFNRDGTLNSRNVCLG